MLAVTFCTLKLAWGQKSFLIGIFWKILHKYLKLHKIHFFSKHLDENFLQHAKIQPPYFSG
jgi:hypothetical protein